MLHSYLVVFPLFFTCGLFAQFETLQTPGNSVANICCFDEFCVFLDAGGSFFKSYDLGETYVMLTAPAPIGMYDMVCIDSSVYFIAASSGPASPTANVFKSIDGGYTWDTLVDTMATYWAFDMANEHKGILVGGIQGSILQTNDGWQTSTLQTTGSPDYYFEAHFIDLNTIFISQIGALKRSLNGGESWSNVYGFSDMTPSHIYSYSSSLIFVAANRSPGLSLLIRSKDGGDTWTKLFNEWNYRLSKILFVSENEGYVCGYHVVGNESILLYTYDGGETWGELQFGYNKRLFEIEQANDSILLIGGEDGLLLRFNRNQVLTGSREVFQHDNPLQVHPNPAASVLNISISTKTGAVNLAQLTVRNLLGQSCYFEHFTLGNTEINREIDVSAWPPGLYLLTLESGGQHWTEKVIIHH